jgi:hypothetical protein
VFDPWLDGTNHLRIGAPDEHNILVRPAPPVLNTATIEPRLSADVPYSEYGVIVTAVDALGRESDSFPFYYDGPNITFHGTFSDGPIVGTVVDGTQKLQVSWSEATGAVKYRAYLGWYYHGVRFTQRIEVDAPILECEFTGSPAQNVTPSANNITAAATVIPYATRHVEYAISAIMPDGETVKSAPVTTAEVKPDSRKMRVEWEPVTRSPTN